MLWNKSVYYIYLCNFKSICRKTDNVAQMVYSTNETLEFQSRNGFQRPSTSTPEFYIAWNRYWKVNPYTSVMVTGVFSYIFWLTTFL
jgi:hypothetical protein